MRGKTHVLNAIGALLFPLMAIPAISAEPRKVCVTPRGVDAWSAFADLKRKSIRVLALGGQPRLLVPSELRNARVDAATLVNSTAAYHGLKVAWSKDAKVAVLHPGAPDERISQLSEALAGNDAAKRLEMVWAAGWIRDARVLPLLVQALCDTDRDVSRMASESLTRLGWPAALALEVKNPKAAWEAVAKDPIRLMKAVEALGRTGYPGTLDVLKKGLQDPAEYASAILMDAAVGDQGGDRAVENARNRMQESVRQQSLQAIGSLGSEAMRPLVVDTLKRDDKDIRIAAVRSLQGMGGNLAVALLEKALADKEIAVRVAAAKALGRKGGEQAVSVLAKALADPDRYVRYAAVIGLADAGGDQAITLLKEKALNDEQKSVRLKALIAIGQLDGENALPLLEKRLADDDKYVRKAAVRGLAAVGGEKTFPPLKRAAADSESMVRISALSALGSLAGAVRVKAVAILEKTLNEKNRSIRIAAIAALGRAGGQGAVSALGKALNDEDPAIRARVAQALGSVGGPNAVSHLKRAMVDTGMSVRYSVVAVLDAFRGQDLEGIVTKALEDQDKSIREKAVQLVGELALESMLPLIDKALADDETAVRMHALKALRHLNGSAAIERLKNALRASSSETRLQAIDELKRIGGPTAMVALASVSEDKAKAVRAAAISAIGVVACPRAKALELIKPLLKSRNTVRGAVLALARMGGEDVLPLLGSPEVVNCSWYERQAAAEAASAVRLIGGPKAISTLKRFLTSTNSTHPNVAARNTAIRSLIELGGKDVVDTLLKAVDDRKNPWSGQKTMVQYFGRIGGPKAKVALEKLARHTRFWHVRRTVAEVLNEPNSGFDKAWSEGVLIGLLNSGHTQKTALRGLRNSKSDAVRDALLAHLTRKSRIHKEVRAVLKRNFSDHDAVKKIIASK